HSIPLLERKTNSFYIDFSYHYLISPISYPVLSIHEVLNLLYLDNIMHYDAYLLRVFDNHFVN
ncbi:MAG: hypothetical protein ACRD93_09405, partial [Nitrososphaeraceae archaeon]